MLTAAVLLIFLIPYKYTPDLGRSLYQNRPSTLVDLQAYRDYYLVNPSLHTARFLGNQILYQLAQLINPLITSNDLRLCPLRITAIILTPFYFLVGTLPVFLVSKKIDWRIFLPTYILLFVSGMYVFYPGDVPSLAMLRLDLAALLLDNLPLTLVFLLLTGLFRESVFHFVFFSAIWLVVTGQCRLEKGFLG